MGKTATTRTSAGGKNKTVKRSSGLVFLVKKSASIRSENLWRLGTLEEGTVFHASHQSKYPGKEHWVWGHATSREGGQKLTYTDHSHCGWVMRTNLHHPESVYIPYKPPGITYKTWNKRVYRSIKFLWINTGRFKPRPGHKLGVRRKNSPVPCRRAHKDDIYGYKNSGGRGKKYLLKGNIGVRYLNTEGWYMAQAKAAHWVFVRQSDIEHVDTERAIKYNSQQAEARSKKKKG